MENFVGVTIGLVGAFLSGYLISYFKEKGKNKALLGDLRKIESEREKIKLEYSKKKYQYEQKSELYKNYMNSLDKYLKNSTDQYFKSFTDEISALFMTLLKTDNDEKTNNEIFTRFVNTTNKIIQESHENLLRFRSELNGFKIIAGERVLSLMEQIDKETDDSLAILRIDAGKLMSMSNHENGLYQEQISAAGNRLSDLQKELYKAMRQELEE